MEDIARRSGVLAVILLGLSWQVSTKMISLDILDQFLNLTQDELMIRAFNYTTILFRADTPIPSSIPTTFAFDPRSPLAKLLPQNVNINAGFEKFDLSTEFDFHKYPTDDLLAPLYKYELGLKQSKLSGQKRVQDPHLVDKDHLAVMLENTFTLPRHSERNSTLTDSIGQYIVRKFGRLGLLTGTQIFFPSQFRQMFWDQDETIAAGSNLIGIYPGENFGTYKDKLVVVGAHWDTTGFTDGYNDNGSGVSAMIEVARALVESGCRLKYSVIFVAFDKEEVGSQGSHEFVRSYLVPRFFKGKKWPEFQGALILDTIMNFNETAGSQIYPEIWEKKIVGDAFEKTKEDNFRGNFISLVSREGPEKELADLIEKHWNKLSYDLAYMENVNSNPNKFKIRRHEIRLGVNLPSTEELTDHINFIRSDHARFWYSNETAYQLSLRGLLFTDTGPYRGAMKECYHRECDSKRLKHKGEFASYDFLAQTVQTVIDTVSDMTGAQCDLSDRQPGLDRYSVDDSSEWVKEAADVTTMEPEADTTTEEETVDTTTETGETKDEQKDSLEKFLNSFYFVSGSPLSWW